jgi:23S rRNA (uracil1939-C5)-methyltransferase
LEKNTLVELDITSTTSDGSGVGRVDGMVVFVPGVALGEKIIAYILKVQKNYAFGRLDKIISESPERIVPNCPTYQRCGGCVFRHITYKEELRVKEQRVSDALKRIGGLDIKLDPIVGAENPDRYRNKAQFPVGRNKEGKLQIGFYALRSHIIIDNRNCLLQPEKFEQVVNTVAMWIEKYKIPVYDEAIHTGLIRHIYLRYAEKTGQVMVTIVANGDELPNQAELIGALTKEISGLKSIVLNSNTEQTNVILGEKCVTLWGEDTIVDILCGLKFVISPLSFYQVNRSQAEKLYAKAAEYAGLTGVETVLDLYCGTGTIGLSMAKNAGKIIGVEVIPEAVNDAEINAKQNNIKNAEFICEDAATAAESLLIEGVTPDVIILDPPRKGCEPALIETVVSLNPKRIVYVSCDPATLARDLSIFEKSGYEANKATPFDMFPRTGHVESVVLITREKI